MSLNQFPRRAFSGAATLQTFTGNGSTTIFTLSQAQTQNECFVYVDDVAQVPVTDYGINATTLTFTSAPGNGSEIIVRGFGVPAPLNTVSDGAITSTKLATGAIEAKLGYTPASAATVASQLATLVDSAPTTLDTLNELAAALGDDANFATTVTNSLAAKANSSDVTNALALKVSIDSSTGAATLPSGTTAQRPASPTNGMVRYNTTLAINEIYQSGSWQAMLFLYAIDYLIVAGGGGGGSNQGGGGGGAGGYKIGSTSIATGSSQSIIVGAGGAGVANNTDGATGGTGADSSFLGITALGGGGGRAMTTVSSPYVLNGASGGSGGGASCWINTGGAIGYGGSATSGQGFAGGNASLTNANGHNGGGGGGATSAGGAGQNSLGGNGGAGLQWLDNNYYAGGGGGGAYYAKAGDGGIGGGGAGDSNTSTDGTAGAPLSGSVQNGATNRGGGGGGGGASSGAGGSGVVIIRYVGTTQKGTGGTVTTSGGYTYHTFTSSGTFTA